jgi:hypothetical protein
MTMQEQVLHVDCASGEQTYRAPTDAEAEQIAARRAQFAKLHGERASKAEAKAALLARLETDYPGVSELF